MMKGPLPPSRQINGFLGEQDARTMLEWVAENERRFETATVASTRRESGADPVTRVALVLRDLGPMEVRLKQRLMEILPDLLQQLRLGGPKPNQLELELAAHGDGAHFKPHIDTFYGDARKANDGSVRDRLLSAVSYFHNEPKGFEGGELRLLRVGIDATEAAPEDVRIIEPVHDSLAVFPSWAPHEVLPVSVPSRKFSDSRFALNCWFCAS